MAPWLGMWSPRCIECRRGLAMRILSAVRLSVCLSVKRVMCDKMKEICAHILIPHERPFTLVLWEVEWLVEGDPFYLKFWSTGPCWSEIADFQPIFARSASSNIDWKSAFSLQQGQFGLKFQAEGVAPTNNSFRQKTRTNNLSCASEKSSINVSMSLFRFVTIHAFDRQTDKRTDGHLAHG